MESLQHNIHKFRQPNEFDSSLGSNFFEAVSAVVKVILIEQFRFDISLQAELNRITVNFLVDVLNDENEILEVLLAG